jgi:metal-sulfur cluster biosynthetic enzyme
MENRAEQEHTEARPEQAEEPLVQRTVTNWSKEDILETLRQVVDPELHMNIVDLGLVYGVEQKQDLIEVDLTLTSPGCPYGPYILHGVKQSLITMKDIRNAEVNVVWDPPWGPDRMTEEAKLELGFDL